MMLPQVSVMLYVDPKSECQHQMSTASNVNSIKCQHSVSVMLYVDPKSDPFDVDILVLAHWV